MLQEFAQISSTSMAFSRQARMGSKQMTNFRAIIVTCLCGILLTSFSTAKAQTIAELSVVLPLLVTMQQVDVNGDLSGSLAESAATPLSTESATVLAESHSFRYGKIQIHPQATDVRDNTGEFLASGTIQADITGDQEGRTNGTVRLDMPNLRFSIDFTNGAPPEIRLDEHGNPSEVVLTGLGKLTGNGQTEYATAMLMIEKIPGQLKWNAITLKRTIVVASYQLTADGHVQFQ